jgi:hypothetical protein
MTLCYIIHYMHIRVLEYKIIQIMHNSTNGNHPRMNHEYNYGCMHVMQYLI